MYLVYSYHKEHCTVGILYWASIQICSREERQTNRKIILKSFFKKYQILDDSKGESKYVKQRMEVSRVILERM